MALISVAGAAVVIFLGEEGNSPETAAQRLVDTMNDPDASNADIFANACEEERRRYSEPDGSLREATGPRMVGAVELVLDGVEQISDTRAIATMHVAAYPDNQLRFFVVKEDGEWKDCGSADE
ncbi:hypothetical protein RM590_13875 [Streptomyces sp. DSM 44938]|uniref:Lumazine-binding protein n=1 Tax=Streptomyces litchfieldiae TaxID=3075543 RepID=A0ABU2MPZ7_9ACTN|nr:hypothetical protein [Streptomyces sp. DSM 44938]MDT0343691.1 hypothetical protein [Streptomyces sp. DSM 44938]